MQWERLVPELANFQVDRFLLRSKEFFISLSFCSRLLRNADILVMNLLQRKVSGAYSSTRPSFLPFSCKFGKGGEVLGRLGNLSEDFPDYL